MEICGELAQAWHAAFLLLRLPGVVRGLDDGPGLFRSLDILEQSEIGRIDRPVFDKEVEPYDLAPVGFAKE